MGCRHETAVPGQPGRDPQPGCAGHPCPARPVRLCAERGDPLRKPEQPRTGLQHRLARRAAGPPVVWQPLRGRALLGQPQWQHLGHQWLPRRVRRGPWWLGRRQWRWLGRQQRSARRDHPLRKPEQPRAQLPGRLAQCPPGPPVVRQPLRRGPYLGCAQRRGMGQQWLPRRIRRGPRLGRWRWRLGRWQQQLFRHLQQQQQPLADLRLG